MKTKSIGFAALLAALSVLHATAQNETRKMVVTSPGTGDSTTQSASTGQSAGVTDLDGKDNGQTVTKFPKIMTITSTAQSDAAVGLASSQDDQGNIVIREIVPDQGLRAGKEEAWLGVSVQEVSEALAAQLGLKPGQGLLVSYVSKDSPAAKAEVQKNDVLVELDGQMLVDSIQLRKLVQMHAEGDSVKLTLFRAGKKQSVSAKVVKKKWDETLSGGNFSPGTRLATTWGSSSSGVSELAVQLRKLADEDRLKEQLAELEKSLQGLGLDKEKMRVEIKRTLEETRKAIEDAVKNSRESLDNRKVLAQLNKELAHLAGKGVELGKDSTVLIKNESSSSRTMVQTDETGSYVIVANPDKHLTIHDKEGKMVFDGPIQTPAEQEKIPKELRPKVQPMLDQLEKGNLEKNETPAVPPAPSAPSMPPVPPVPPAASADK